MDLLEYLAIWGRRWKIIIAATLLGVAVAAGVSALMTPKYIATTQMFVTATGGASVVEAYQGNLFGQERVSSYVRLAEGKQIAQRVIDQLQIDLTPEELQSMITAVPIPNSVLMTISVKNSNPTLARDLANAVLVQTSQLVEELETSARGGSPAAAATLVDEADLPTSAATPKWIPNLLYGLAGGLLVGLVGAIARDKLDRSVRSDEAAAAAAGAPTLGTVPDGSPSTPNGLPFGAQDPAASESYRSLRTAVLATLDSTSSGAVIVAGPTEEAPAVTLGLAGALAESGRSVVVVESNLHTKDISARLNLSGRQGLTDVLTGGTTLDTVITRTELNGFDVLPAGSPSDSPSRLLAGTGVIEVLKYLANEYDFVIISGSPILEYSDSLSISEWTDGLLLVARPGSTTDKQLAAVAEKARIARTRILGVVSTVGKRPATKPKPPPKPQPKAKAKAQPKTQAQAKAQAQPKTPAPAQPKANPKS